MISVLLKGILYLHSRLAPSKNICYGLPWHRLNTYRIIRRQNWHISSYKLIMIYLLKSLFIHYKLLTTHIHFTLCKLTVEFCVRAVLIFSNQFIESQMSCVWSADSTVSSTSLLETPIISIISSLILTKNVVLEYVMYLSCATSCSVVLGTTKAYFLTFSNLLQILKPFKII